MHKLFIESLLTNSNWEALSSQTMQTHSYHPKHHQISHHPY
jgi:hypothetical protein